MALDLLIGRGDERRALNELIQQRKSVLILGDEGVGKSALVEDALANSGIKNILYSKRSTTLKETLVNLLQSATNLAHLIFWRLRKTAISSWRLGRSTWCSITSFGWSQNFTPF